MKIKEIKSKSIITKSNLPDADYVINPYVGCMNSCFYCYARFMKRFTGHTEDWGSFMDVKINSVDLIPDVSTQYRNKSIFLSSVTDPYNALERKYKLTRRIIEKLINLQPRLGILTKSHLVTRDIDLFKKFKHCEVGITITSLDDNIRKEIEPLASPVQKRIEALKLLKENKIRTYAFIGPILPYITDYKAIIKKVEKYVDCIMFENLNIKGTIWDKVLKWLKSKHPDLIEKYKNIYFTKSDYWDIVEKEINALGKKSNKEFLIYFHHSKR